MRKLLAISTNNIRPRIFFSLSIFFILVSLSSLAQCPSPVVTTENEGLENWVCFKQQNGTKVLKKGNTVCSDWFDGAWTNDCDLFTTRTRYKNCTRTDECQDILTCWYTGFPVPGVMMVDIKIADPYNVKHEWTEYDYERHLALWMFCNTKANASITDLKEALASATRGSQRDVVFSGQCPQITLGSFYIVEKEDSIPKQISNIEIYLNQKKVNHGELMLADKLGANILRIVYFTNSGGIVSFTIPFDIVKPVELIKIGENEYADGRLKQVVRLRSNNISGNSGIELHTSTYDTANYRLITDLPDQVQLLPGEEKIFSIFLDVKKLIVANESGYINTPPVSIFLITKTNSAIGVIYDSINLQFNLLKVTTELVRSKPASTYEHWESSIGLGYYIPSDVDIRSYGNGIPFSLGIGYFPHQRFSISAAISIWNRSQDENTVYKESTNSILSYPFTISGNYYLSGNEKIESFIGGGFGLYSYQKESNGYTIMPDTMGHPVKYPFSSKENSSTIGMQMQFGVNYTLMHKPKLSLGILPVYSYAYISSWEQNMGGFSVYLLLHYRW